MARMRKYSLTFCLITITNQRPELGIFSFEFLQSLKIYMNCVGTFYK